MGSPIDVLTEKGSRRRDEHRRQKFRDSSSRRADILRLTLIC